MIFCRLGYNYSRGDIDLVRGRLECAESVEVFPAMTAEKAVKIEFSVIRWSEYWKLTLLQQVPVCVRIWLFFGNPLCNRRESMMRALDNILTYTAQIEVLKAQASCLRGALKTAYRL